MTNPNLGATKMKNNIDFKTITACGECCVGCKKKEDGISL